MCGAPRLCWRCAALARCAPAAKHKVQCGAARRSRLRAARRRRRACSGVARARGWRRRQRTRPPADVRTRCDAHRHAALPTPGAPLPCALPAHATRNTQRRALTRNRGCATQRASISVLTRWALRCCHARGRQERAARAPPGGAGHHGASLRARLIRAAGALRPPRLTISPPPCDVSRNAPPLRRSAVRGAAADRARARARPAGAGRRAGVAAVGMGHPHVARSRCSLPRGTRSLAAHAYTLASGAS